MKIVLANEIRAAEDRLFQSVPEYSVMECAGRAVVDLLSAEGLLGQGVLVLCGAGNNGGDGFVIARLLLGIGEKVTLAFVGEGKALRGSALQARAAFEAAGGVVLSDPNPTDISAVGTIVDALYGTGFHGALPDGASRWAKLCAEWGREGSKIVSVDLPSGVECDSGEIRGESFSADYTVTFQALKPAHLFYPGASRCGVVVVRDIGIPLETISRELITRGAVEEIVRRIPVAHGHKGERGRVSVVGGSPGMFGAPILSAFAALRCGAGVVTAFLPEGGAIEALREHPELMVRPLTEELELPSSDSVVVGPGLGDDQRKLLLSLFTRYSKLPFVIDADALNTISTHPELMTALPEQAILTPHPGEAGRLLGITAEEVQRDRLGAAAEIVIKTGRTVVLKGARSIIADSDGRVFVCGAAAEVLGTAGSGDVLAGLLGALLARGLTPLESAVVGVFAHGEVGMQRVGDIAGLTASDLLVEIPVVLNLLVAAFPRGSELTTEFRL